jgi:hypothetical protein
MAPNRDIDFSADWHNAESDVAANASVGVGVGSVETAEFFACSNSLNSAVLAAGKKMSGKK